MVSKYFAAGFVQGLGENLKERQDYIRDMTQRKTDFLMQEGLKRRGKVMDARLQFQKATDFLTSRGMDEDKVIALLEENPDEVVRLASTSLKREQDGMTLSGEILNKAVEISSDYKPQAGSVTEALDLIIPIFNKSEYSTPEAKEKGIFAKLFGSPTEAIDRNVYGQKLLGEYTGADIAASMGDAMVKRGRMSGSVKASYASLAEPLSASEANALRSQTIATYDSMLDNEITDLTRTITRLGPKNELTPDELDEIAAGVGITEYTDQNDLFIKVTDRNKTLSEISKEKDKFKRFERMVEEFGAGEAVSMSGGRTEIFAPKNGFSTATFDTIREYGKDVKETPAVEVEATPSQPAEPKKPAGAPEVGAAASEETTTVSFVESNGRAAEIKDVKVAEVEGNTVAIDPNDGTVVAVVETKSGQKTDDPFTLAQTTQYVVKSTPAAKGKAWAKAMVAEGLDPEFIDAEVIADWFKLNNLDVPQDVKDEVLRAIQAKEVQ